MAIYWKLEKALRRAGIENANQLADRAGIGYPAATRIYAHLEAHAPLGRFDMRTLNTLARVFRVKPWALLEHVPD